MLPQALKLKVIQQYGAGGKLQKDIAHDLGISTGSVSGILKASREDKQKHEDNSNSSPQEPKQSIVFEDPRVVARDTVLKPEEARPIPDSNLQYLEIQNVQRQQPSQLSPQSPSNNSTYTSSTSIEIGSPSSTAPRYSGVGKAVTTINTNSNVIPRDGGPLLHLLFEDNSTDEEEVIPPVTYSNLPSSVPPTVSMSLYPNTNIPSNFNPYFNPYQNNINPQISKPETQESLEPKTQPKPQPHHQQYHDDNNDSNYDDQEVIDPELKREIDDSWQKNLFQKIIEGRKERQQQLQLIEKRQQELDEEKRQIENIRQDLEARENKLRSVEDLIPSSKHLKDIGMSFDQALVWIDCIQEVAQKERIDERTAAWKLADMLRSFKGLCGLENAIQKANQQLAILSAANDQQRKAISTLVNLQSAGFSEKDIMELTALVNTWNKSMGSPGLSQGNGHGMKKLDTELWSPGH